MIKVTFLTGEFPPMQGGIADHTAYLAHHLVPYEVEPAVLISRRWQETQAAAEAADPAEIVPVYTILPDWGWRCWPAVSRFLETHQPDLLHIQYQAAAFDLGGWVNWLPWFLKRRRRSTRLVTTFHDLRVPYIFPKAGSFRWRSMLALAGYSDGVICTNREDLAVLQEVVGEGEPADRATEEERDRKFTIHHSPLLTHIPLGSNVEPQPPSDFDRAAWRSQYPAGPETVLIAYFGFLNESKGGEELIEALARLGQQGVDARLVLIGGAVGHADPTNRAYAQRVQAQIDQYGLADRVYRTGYVNLPAVSAHLLAADLVVMPYRDGVSFRRTTLIAALRHGCPVVSTSPADPATIPEIQPGENMLLVPPRQPELLAEAIAVLANNPALRQHLGEGARALGRLFEWERIAAATATLYRRLAGIEGEAN